MKYAVQQLRHAASTLRKKLARRVLNWRLRNASGAEVVTAERRLRGREQLARLREADIVVVSFGKSGRTWLRVMLSHLFRIQHGLPENALLGFDNFHNMNPAVPKIFFTHDNYIKDVIDDPASKAPFYDKPVVLMVRDPRDVAVSQFFQWKFRLKPNKVTLNNYPPRDRDTSLFEFVTGDNDGGSLRAVVEYLNVWAAEAPRVKRLHVLRYEDLRSDPQGELATLLAFMQVEATPEEQAAAIEHASFDNMKKMEGADTFRFAGRMRARDRDNPDSYKVRRAKVGGYRDYFDDEQVAAIDQQLRNSLDALYGYSRDATREQTR
ncbi:sulfotransferase domain-containing protein [Chromatocurvus halotolerans]|uniref:Alcohol sulfotransferase n=1 Tax=Chromatocurvus halotolerans TaxID=1132028 RepID=A0A4R2L150_9GAMM|nr:sulfotransferase domain-containing protein [Chromatocurvus halotolerans]TCO76268.1 alcohol sulfotransferase [Chromatocurvus halotolerans]